MCLNNFQSKLFLFFVYESSFPTVYVCLIECHSLKHVSFSTLDSCELNVDCLILTELVKGRSRRFENRLTELYHEVWVLSISFEHSSALNNKDL